MIHTVVTIRLGVSDVSFRGNYSFLNSEIVENSNSCRKFQYPDYFKIFISICDINGAA